MWSIACMAKFQVMNSTIGLRPGHRRADAQAGEAVLGDRRVDHAPGAELLEQALADLVGALVLGDLLAHQEHVGVAPHLLGHGVAQGLAHGLPDHLGAGRAPRARATTFGRLAPRWCRRRRLLLADWRASGASGRRLWQASAAGVGASQGALVLAVAQQHARSAC